MRYFQTYVSECSGSPAPPHWVSGSASCGETPEPRFVPFWGGLLVTSTPCPIPPTPVRVSSLRALSTGIPYVSISHPNRGCAASVEARPTSGTAAEEARFSPGFEVYFSPPAQCASSCRMSGAAAARRCVRSTPLYYPPQSTSAFQVGRDVLPGRDSPPTPLVSLVTACIMCKGAELERAPTHGIPLPPSDTHTGLLAQSSCPPVRFIFSHVFTRRSYF